MKTECTSTLHAGAVNTRYSCQMCAIYAHTVLSFCQTALFLHFIWAPWLLMALGNSGEASREETALSNTVLKVETAASSPVTYIYQNESYAYIHNYIYRKIQFIFHGLVTSNKFKYLLSFVGCSGYATEWGPGRDNRGLGCKVLQKFYFKKKQQKKPQKISSVSVCSDHIGWVFVKK